LTALRLLCLALLTCSLGASSSLAQTGADLRTPLAVSAAGTAIPAAAGATILLFGNPGGLQGPGLVLLAGGVILGPSAGSAMLGDGRRAAIGVLIRAGASAAFIASMDYRFALGMGQSEEGALLFGNALIGASLGVLAAGVAYNFVTLPASAEAGLRLDAASGALVPGVRVRF
jgi:hypothetical protein